MIEPPTEIDGARVLFVAEVDSEVTPTGATKHSLGTVVDGQLVRGPAMDPFAALAIAQYEGANDFYLFYLDTGWRAVTDTFHYTIEDAKAQAEFEYEGITSKWVEVRQQ
jgi:hypothetical protein